MNPKDQTILTNFLQLMLDYPKELAEDLELELIQTALKQKRKEMRTFTESNRAIYYLPKDSDTYQELRQFLIDQGSENHWGDVDLLRLISLLEPIEVTDLAIYLNLTPVTRLELTSEELKESIQTLINTTLVSASEDYSESLSITVSANSDIILKDWLLNDTKPEGYEPTLLEEGEYLMNRLLLNMGETVTNLHLELTILKRIARLEHNLGNGYPLQTYFFEKLMDWVKLERKKPNLDKLFYMLDFLKACQVTDLTSVLNLCQTLEGTDNDLINKYIQKLIDSVQPDAPNRQTQH
jgi:hypothetical protein